ncbi:response regulator [Marinobacterium rhizophilum]|uniref:Response regulator n=1 Tax=Marinobacterium rhizophilum TaxID=420402 RepID=A0ABY5HIN6_9GAMM|nr:response regulator [Marinobacterium rhizophilum]UTW12238.1 response regulator [Marinobacterium rhizophilum]
MESEKTLDILSLAFLERLPARIQAICLQAGRVGPGLWQPEPAQELCRLLHSLVGAAGTFGQPVLGSKARYLLEFAERWSDDQQGPGKDEWAVWVGLLAALKDVPLNSRYQHRLYQGSAIDPAVAAIEPGGLDDAEAARPCIHLLEDDEEQAAMLQALLESHGYEVRVFEETARFRDAWLAGQRADLVLADMVFAERLQAGAEAVVELLSMVENTPPVVFLSARDDVKARLAAFRAGASRYLTKPVQPARLFELVDELSLRRPAAPYRVMVVDDDAAQAELTARPLREAGMDLDVLTQPLDTLNRLRSFDPDLLLLNISMQQASGPEIAAILREEDRFAFLPILFVSAEKSAAKQLIALGMGGDDFLLKPIRASALLAAVRARAWRARRMRVLGARYQALAYEHERLLDAVAQGVALAHVDSAANLTTVNARFRLLLGYEGVEPWRETGLVELSRQLHDPIAICLAVGETWQGELQLQHRNGHALAVESTITPFLDGSGSSYKALVIVLPK